MVKGTGEDSKRNIRSYTSAGRCQLGTGFSEECLWIGLDLLPGWLPARHSSGLTDGDEGKKISACILVPPYHDPQKIASRSFCGYASELQSPYYYQGWGGQTTWLEDWCPLRQQRVPILAHSFPSSLEIETSVRGPDRFSPQLGESGPLPGTGQGLFAVHHNPEFKKAF